MSKKKIGPEKNVEKVSKNSPRKNNEKKSPNPKKGIQKWQKVIVNFIKIACELCRPLKLF